MAPLFPDLERPQHRKPRSRSRSGENSLSPPPSRAAPGPPPAESLDISALDETPASDDLERTANFNTDVAEAIQEAQNETAEEVEYGKGAQLASPVTSIMVEESFGPRRTSLVSPPSATPARSDASASLIRELQLMEDRLTKKMSQMLRIEQERHCKLDGLAWSAIP